MLSNFQLISRITKENIAQMELSHKSVSQEDMLNEWKIIQSAQKTPSLFKPLYDKYYEPIFRFIFRRTTEESLSADICSQVFIKAIQKLSQYQYKGVPFSAWLYRIASNEIAQHFRNLNKNRIVSVDNIHFNNLIVEVDEKPDESLRSALLECLDELKESDLQLIELRFFEKRAFKEIAEILNITESNAKVKTYRILERLKKTLLERNFNDPN